MTKITITDERAEGVKIAVVIDLPGNAEIMVSALEETLERLHVDDHPLLTQYDGETGEEGEEIVTVVYKDEFARTLMIEKMPPIKEGSNVRRGYAVARWAADGAKIRNEHPYVRDPFDPRSCPPIIRDWRNERDYDKEFEQAERTTYKEKHEAYTAAVQADYRDRHGVAIRYDGTDDEDDELE